MNQKPLSKGLLSILISSVFGMALFWGNRAPGAIFTVPYDATLYLAPVGGFAAGTSEFGLGTSQTNVIPVFRGLPNDPEPSDEVQIGFVLAGTELNFYLKTEFVGMTNLALSVDMLSDASRYAFMDLDSSLGLGGEIVEQTSPTTWTLHLDDALSYLFDDDDDDVLIQIRLVVEDTDGDGVLNGLDQCPNTAAGAIVNADGCSIDQLVPCPGPLSGGKWRNHGQYVSAVAFAIKAFLDAYLVTEEQAEEIIAAAAQSNCGKP